LGYMPTDPEALNAELAKRNHLVMLGAFVPVALKNPATHADGVAKAVKTARLIAAVATTQAPYLVLADDNEPIPRGPSGRAHSRERGIEQGRMEDFCRRRRQDRARRL